MYKYLPTHFLLMLNNYSFYLTLTLKKTDTPTVQRLLGQISGETVHGSSQDLTAYASSASVQGK